MRHALDPSVPPAQSEQLSRWLLLEDSVLLYQAALTLGKDGLKELDAEYATKEAAPFLQAKTKFAICLLSSTDLYPVQAAILKPALALLEEEPARTGESLQCKCPWQGTPSLI